MSKLPTPEVEFDIVQVDLGDGPIPIRVLRKNIEPVIDRAREGDVQAVGEALRSINDALSSGNQLTPSQSEYLTDGLATVLGDLRRFGGPFGVVTKRGRPTGTGTISGWNRVRLGRLVDKLHHPDRYGLEIPPTPIEDNAIGPGAYTLVAEGTGVSIPTVKRAYTSFLRIFGRRPT